MFGSAFPLIMQTVWSQDTAHKLKSQLSIQYTFSLGYQSGTWCSGITPAQHAGGPGFNPQCVQLIVTYSKRYSSNYLFSNEFATTSWDCIALSQHTYRVISIQDTSIPLGTYNASPKFQ